MFLWRLRPFFSPSQLFALYRGLICLCMEYGSHVWGGSTNTALLNWVESKTFRLIFKQTVLILLSHRRNDASLLIFYHYFRADCSSEIANRMLPLSSGLGAQDFLLLLIHILSIFLMQELTSIFTLSSITLVNSGIFFLCVFFHLPMT